MLTKYYGNIQIFGISLEKMKKVVAKGMERRGKIIISTIQNKNKAHKKSPRKMNEYY